MSPPKDHPSFLNDLYTKQLETGDYGPPLESISEINDSVFASASQTRQTNNNNNSAPSELFHPTTLTPDLLSPSFSTNGELAGRQTWSHYQNYDSVPTDNTTQTSTNEQNV